MVNRLLPIKSKPNFRELGGYMTQDGHEIKYHKLLRSSNLEGLNKHDLDYLNNYGIKYNVDLRSRPEITGSPDQPIEGADYLWIPIFSYDQTQSTDSPQQLENYVKKNTESGFAHMIDVYENMVTEVEAQKGFTRVLQIMTENTEPDKSVLFHCTAGKDRTGLTAFYILYILGVPMDTIFEDYLLTNVVYKDKINDLENSNLDAQAKHSIISLSSVKPEYLKAAIKMMKKMSGTIDGYLSQYLHVTPEQISQLKANYLK